MNVRKNRYDVKKTPNEKNHIDKISVKQTFKIDAIRLLLMHAVRLVIYNIVMCQFYIKSIANNRNISSPSFLYFQNLLVYLVYMIFDKCGIIYVWVYRITKNFKIKLIHCVQVFQLFWS